MEKEIELEQEAIVVYSGGGAVNSVNGYTGDVVLTTSDLENTSDYQTGTEVESAISTAIAGKQDTLTAGNNITISNNTISATDTTYSAGTGLTLNGTQFSVNTETIATQQDVSNEATARENADTNLQGQIDAISASSDVTDIVGTYADLQAYDTTHLKDNDIIKVLQDESQNGETTYYRWSTSTQTFTLIGEEGPYYTKSQTDTLLQAKQDNLTAGANITIASDNTISATDTTYSDFTGTDGTAAGTAGLVPAPATTDAGKFLSASGLWEEVAGGGVTELTTADYNWNSVAGDSTTTPFNSVAIGLLDDGVYTCKDNVNIAIHPSPNFPTFTTIPIIIVSKDSTSVLVSNRRKVIYLRDDNLYVGTANFIDGTGSDYHYLLDQYSLTNSLTSSSTATALTANQGKTLKDLIDSLIVKGTGAPTTSTVGTVGKLYEDTTNGDLYICTDATNPYVWEEVGAGGGGGPTVVQTTGTSQTDVMSQNAVTSMVFADPASKNHVQIGSGANAAANTGNATVAIGNSAKAYQNGGDGSSVIYPTAVGPEAVAKGNRSLALGANSSATYTGSVAVGAGANATSVGQFDIGSKYTAYGYNSSNYRLLTGLYDPQSAHDAATKGYVDPTTDSSAPTTATVGRLGQIQIDTTTATAYMCVAVDTVTPAYTWKQITA